MGRTNLKEAFMQKLIFLRKERGETQAVVANALGISDKTYSKWETGDNEPDFQMIEKLADYFGVSPLSFFTEHDTAQTEVQIEAEFDGLLNTADSVGKAFEIQFYAIRTLAKKAICHQLSEQPIISPPINRVNPKNDHAITAFASSGAYSMMFNGLDANISLSIMPSADQYTWMRTENSRLSDYLSLIGDSDMLRCLCYMISSDYANRYSARYLGEKSGVAAEKVTELLHKAELLGICKKTIAHIGDKTAELFSITANQMLLGIFILTHLSLPETEKNGCYYTNMPVNQEVAEGKVN